MMKRIKDSLYIIETNILKNKYFLVVLIFFIIITFSNLFAIPRILYDEPLYSYTALNFLEKGNFIHSFNSFSGKEFCLYPLILSFIYKFFGVSFEAGRILSAVLGIACLLLFYFYCRICKYPDILIALLRAFCSFLTKRRCINSKTKRRILSYAYG